MTKPTRTRRSSSRITILLGCGILLCLFLWVRPRYLGRQLIDALIKGNTDQALALLKEGADPNTRVNLSHSPTALEILGRLLHGKPLPINTNATALMMISGADYNPEASECSIIPLGEERIELTKRSILQGADIEARDPNGMTAFMWAAANDRTDIMSILLEHGAAIDNRDKDGRTALHYAASRGCTEAVRLILKHLPYRTMNVDTRDNEGTTALIDASHDVMIDIMTDLLNKGAKVDIQANDGTTALFHAANCHELKATKLLLQHHANPNLPERGGITPLMDASGVDDFEDAPPGESSAHPDRSADIMALLIEYGAAVNAHDEYGRTAFFMSVDHSNLRAVKLLLRHKADPNLKANFNGISYKRAILTKQSSPELIRLLKQCGALH